jgi:hypothetical protein
MNLKIGKRVSFTSRKKRGVGKIGAITDSETGQWVTVVGKVTHARPATTGDDWSALPDPVAATLVVRPSQLGAPT